MAKRLQEEFKPAVASALRNERRSTKGMFLVGAGAAAEQGQHRADRSAWELGQDLFGTDRSSPGMRNASARVKDLIPARLRAKRFR